MTREERMNKRRETGKTHIYKPISYEKGTNEYNAERRVRAEKNVNHRLPCAYLRSVFAKLENQLVKEELEHKKLEKKFKKAE